MSLLLETNSFVLTEFFKSNSINFIDELVISQMLSNILNDVYVLQSNPDISEEEIDLALEMAAKFMQPHWLMIMH